MDRPLQALTSLSGTRPHIVSAPYRDASSSRDLKELLFVRSMLVTSEARSSRFFRWLMLDSGGLAHLLQALSP